MAFELPVTQHDARERAVGGQLQRFPAVRISYLRRDRCPTGPHGRDRRCRHAKSKTVVEAAVRLGEKAATGAAEEGVVAPTAAAEHVDLAGSRPGRIDGRTVPIIIRRRTNRRTIPRRCPCMSYRPQAFGRFRPTGLVWSDRVGAVEPGGIGSAPFRCRRELNFVVVPARQAYSHCASVGRLNFTPEAAERRVSFCRNFWQSSQVTVSTGFRGP